MAKVLFINPMVREEDEPKHVPMGMAQLAALAIKEGHQIQVYDHNAWRAEDEEVVSVLKSDKWEVIDLGGITTAYASIKKLSGFIFKFLNNFAKILLSFRLRSSFQIASKILFIKSFSNPFFLATKTHLIKFRVSIGK